MLPLRAARERDRIDSLLKLLEESIDRVDDRAQHVFANHLVLAASGYIETSTLAILSEYAIRHGDEKFGRYVEKTISRENSLSCEKIKNILEKFDKGWWGALEAETPIDAASAIDSLKTLRDQIAHGKVNGTGFSTVRDYYARAKRFVDDFAAVVLA